MQPVQTPATEDTLFIEVHARSSASPSVSSDAQASIVGTGISGRVSRLLSRSSQFSVGDRVFAFSLNDAGPASHKELPGHQVYRLPPEIELDMAATLGTYVYAWSIVADAIEKLDAKTLYVSGGSGFSTLVRRFASFRDMDVIEDFSDIASRTAGGGVDAIVDELAGAGFAERLQGLRDFGHVCICGWRAGDPPGFFETMWNGLDRCPAVQFCPPPWNAQQQPQLKALFDEVVGLLITGRIKPLPVSEMAINELKLEGARDWNDSLLVIRS